MAAERKGRTEFESLLSEYFVERDLIQEQIDELDTDRLLRTARRLYLEVPDRPRGGEDIENEHWIRGHVTGAWLLKDAGIRHLRRLVRAEQKELQEARLGWLPPLTGALGALTGLLAVLLSHC